MQQWKREKSVLNKNVTLRWGKIAHVWKNQIGKRPIMSWLSMMSPWTIQFGKIVSGVWILRCNYISTDWVGDKSNLSAVAWDYTLHSIDFSILFRIQKGHWTSPILHLIHDCGTFTSTTRMFHDTTIIVERWVQPVQQTGSISHQCELPKKEPSVKSTRMKFNKAHWYMKSQSLLSTILFPSHVVLVFAPALQLLQCIHSEKNERCARCSKDEELSNENSSSTFMLQHFITLQFNESFCQFDVRFFVSSSSLLPEPNSHFCESDILLTLCVPSLLLCHANSSIHYCSRKRVEL